MRDIDKDFLLLKLQQEATLALFEMKHKGGLFNPGLSKTQTPEAFQVQASIKDMTKEDETRAHFDFKPYLLSVIESAADRVQRSSRSQAVYEPSDSHRKEEK